MNYRPYIKFYRDCFPFIGLFGIVTGLIFGIWWGIFFFTVPGSAVGMLGYQFFNKQQFYTYYNLGITKWKIFKTIFFINILVAIPIFSLLIGIYLLIDGTFN